MPVGRPHENKRPLRKQYGGTIDPVNPLPLINKKELIKSMRMKRISLPHTELMLETTFLPL